MTAAAEVVEVVVVVVVVVIACQTLPEKYGVRRQSSKS